MIRVPNTLYMFVCSEGSGYEVFNESKESVAKGECESEVLEQLMAYLGYRLEYNIFDCDNCGASMQASDDDKFNVYLGARSPTGLPSRVRGIHQ